MGVKKYIFSGKKPSISAVSNFQRSNAGLFYFLQANGVHIIPYDIRARLATLWTWAGKELKIPNVVADVAKPSYKEPEIIPNITFAQRAF